MWNERYGAKEFAYGTAANDFLIERAKEMPKGKVLCLAEGEGRNAVWLAEQGYTVTGVDQSDVGLKKAQALATERGVSITTECIDLAKYDWEPESWQGVVSIFCHLPPPLRKKVHADIAKGLAPGGVLILEAYSPRQLDYKTGGPPVPQLLFELEETKSELAGLEFQTSQEVVREIQEGEFHRGSGSVIQIVAVKPR